MFLCLGFICHIKLFCACISGRYYHIMQVHNAMTYGLKMLINNFCGGTHLNVYILRIVFKILYAHIEGEFIIRLAPITTKTCIPLGAICMLSSTTKKGESHVSRFSLCHYVFGRELVWFALSCTPL